jgi:hypothetical protein
MPITRQFNWSNLYDMVSYDAFFSPFSALNDIYSLIYIMGWDGVTNVFFFHRTCQLILIPIEISYSEMKETRVSQTLKL